MVWRFYEHLTSSMRSHFRDWLNAQIPVAQAKIESRIKYCAAMCSIERPEWERLTRDGKGLIAIRVKGPAREQYRPLACDDELMCDGLAKTNRIFLLGGAIEKGGKYLPTGVVDTHQKRKEDLIEHGRFREYKETD